MSIKRVFILGAGFSKGAANIPIAQELFREVDNFAEKHDMGYWAETKAYLMDLAADDMADVDIEDRLSLLDALIDLYQQFNDRLPNRAVKCRKILIEATNQFLSQFFLKSFNSGITRFVDALLAEDTVITFNWDSILEATLYQSQKPFSTRPDAKGCVKVLKLHGSIDWVSLPDGANARHPELFEEIQPNLIRAKSYDYPDGPRPAASPMVALDRPFFIIPPTFYKKDAIAQLTSLWDEAYLSLVSADEIWIIGYSLPKPDYHARALFRTALEYKERNSETFSVHVINPDRKIERYVKQALHNQIDFYQTTFENFYTNR